MDVTKNDYNISSKFNVCLVKNNKKNNHYSCKESRVKNVAYTDSFILQCYSVKLKV